MHDECYEFLRGHAQRLRSGSTMRILEIGSLNINGSARDLFTGAALYWGIDGHAGPGVDEVADGATWRSDEKFDLVICTEVFEHTREWRPILAAARTYLRPAGELLATCAASPRAPHSGIDGGEVRPGEWYANIQPAALTATIADLFSDWTVNYLRRGDIQAWARL